MTRTALALLLGAGLASCSSAREPRTHAVEIRGMQFVPAALEVAVGDTVVWTNADVVPHTVTAAAGAPAAFDSGQLPNRQTWQYKVAVAGEQPYGCTFHPTMHGKLIAR